jgi:hypothetical protein
MSLAPEERRHLAAHLKPCRSCGRIHPFEVRKLKHQFWWLRHYCSRKTTRTPEIYTTVSGAMNIKELVEVYNKQQETLRSQLPFKTVKGPLDIIDDIEVLAEELRKAAKRIGSAVGREKLLAEADKWQRHGDFLQERLQKDVEAFLKQNRRTTP